MSYQVANSRDHSPGHVQCAALAQIFWLRPCYLSHSGYFCLGAPHYVDPANTAGERFQSQKLSQFLLVANVVDVEVHEAWAEGYCVGLLP